MTVVPVLAGFGARSLAFSPDGTVLAVAATACSPGQIFTGAPGLFWRCPSVRGHAGSLVKVQAAADACLLQPVCIVVTLVDPADLCVLATLPPPLDASQPAFSIQHLAFLADGLHLVSKVQSCGQGGLVAVRLCRLSRTKAGFSRSSMLMIVRVLENHCTQAAQWESGAGAYNLLRAATHWAFLGPTALLACDAGARRLALGMPSGAVLVLGPNGKADAAAGALHGRALRAAHFLIPKQVGCLPLCLCELLHISTPHQCLL